ncbi:hypothetical protein BU17DRAFT_68562 [Hysterangium stoloniferum]|nr:hypothetical protein BU17DRAFT_68562 [Hysterangium stoloniferum]
MEISFLTVVRVYLATEFSWVAAATVMVYDYGLTIEHEVVFQINSWTSPSHILQKAIWQRQWCLGKCLYLFTRYLGLFTSIFDISVRDLQTRAWIWWKVLSGSAAVISAEVILLCRVYAVYRRNNKLLMILAIVLALGVFASLLVMGLNIHAGCLASEGYGFMPQVFWSGILSPLIYETILCSLMILKAIQNYRDGYASPLLSKMVHDSIFATLFIQCSFYFLKKQEWAQFLLV